MTVTDTKQDDRPQLNAKSYKSDVKPIWCSGCGNYAVLNAMMKSFAELGIPNHEIAVISGIGCSSRLPGYLKTYGFNTLHGRAVPIATGTKLARPELTVLAVGGDGDMFSIGGGHLSHAARRNIDITLIVMDNRIYGLTKGQMSPTTPMESYTSTTVYGSYDPPVDMVRFMLAYKTSYVARAFSGAIKPLQQAISDGIRHRGFSFIHVLSPCVTYRGKGEYDTIRDIAADVPEDHDVTDLGSALRLSMDTEKLFMGLLYKDENKPTYDERIMEMRKIAKSSDVVELSHLIDEYRP